MTEYRTLEDADDVSDEMLASTADCVEWFDGEPSMPTEDFIDKFANGYLGSDADGLTWDIDSYDNPAVRKIMRHARAVRRGDA